MTSHLVIFGFGGDLTKRKLIPALYKLEQSKTLNDDMVISAVTRKAVDLQEYMRRIEEYLPDNFDPAVLSKLFARLSVVQLDISKREDFPELKAKLMDRQPDSCSAMIFYFAIPPTMFEGVIDSMVQVGLHECGEAVENRLLIEKPFGYDIASAKKLIDLINRHFGEESVYRIDHYLAKDTAQNILHFRFHNPMFQQLWNNRHIEYIQISALEDIDIQGRGGFYEQTGAVRDMLQGHLLQLLALTTMDEPFDMSARSVRRQRQRLLDSIRRPSGEIESQAVRAQYEGYRDEVENQTSNVETFAALRLEIESSRWRGVPLLLRAGKAMNEKTTEVNIGFKRSDNHTEQNVLTFRLQPSAGIAINLASKKPGLDSETDMITLDHCFADGPHQVSDAYEKILFDALNGDQTLFPTDQEIISSWEIVEPILDHWKAQNTQPERYAKGADSVAIADKLAKDNDTNWIRHSAWVCQPRSTPEQFSTN